MSLTAHYTELYILRKHFPKLNFRWMIIGSSFPDAFIFDRLFMFTIDMRMHRDFGFGYFHTLFIPAVVTVLIWWGFGRWPALSFLIASWLHVISDTFDEIGCMLLWPLSTHKYSIGIWPWSDKSLWYDLWTYFTTPASALFELFFFVWAVIIVRQFNSTSFLKKLISPWVNSSWSEQ